MASKKMSRTARIVHGFLSMCFGEKAAEKWKMANAHRETFFQPRYVLETDEKGMKFKRRLEAGEIHPNSKRYPIFNGLDTINDMQAFGERV